MKGQLPGPDPKAAWAQPCPPTPTPTHWHVHPNCPPPPPPHTHFVATKTDLQKRKALTPEQMIQSTGDVVSNWQYTNRTGYSSHTHTHSHCRRVAKPTGHGPQSASGALGPLQLGLTQVIPLHLRAIRCDVSLTLPTSCRGRLLHQGSNRSYNM